MVPLQESAILEQPTEDAGEDSQATAFNDYTILEETKTNGDQAATKQSRQNSINNETLCEDLEKLLETGYAELIRTQSYDQGVKGVC